MSDETEEIKGTIEAVAGLVKAVPVYQDVLQPAAQEVGKALGTMAKTIHIVLAPVSALVWGYDQIKEFVSVRVAEKLKNVPAEQICPPNPMVAGPALEALKYAGQEPTLSEMYANLLATSLDSKTAATAHPAFVEIIKQITPPEAKLIEHLTKLKSYPVVCNYSTSHSTDSFSSFHREQVVHRTFCRLCMELMEVLEKDALTFLDNLKRLQILDMDSSFSQEFKERRHFSLIESKQKGARELFEIRQKQYECIKFTAFGVCFVTACIKSKADSG